MLREKRYPLTQAARELGIARETLRYWLATDLGLILPRVARGSKVVIYERDLEKLMAKRRDARAMVSR